MPRSAPSLAAAVALALAACGGGNDSGPTCPGERVAPFGFEGDRIFVGDPALAGLDPAPSLRDCGTELGYPAKLAGFDATLARDPITPAAALCTSRGVILYGQRSGTRYVVETATTGAVLGACAETCAASMRLVVAGDLETSPDGEPTGFAGVLIEYMSALDGSLCGETCAATLPCAARYAVTGVP